MSSESQHNTAKGIDELIKSHIHVKSEKPYRSQDPYLNTYSFIQERHAKWKKLLEEYFIKPL